jgi:F-type H+-transporting ATPase subunit alpha
MKKVSGTTKLSLAQYYELEAFSQFASELDEATQAQLTRGKRVVEALKQKNGAPYKLWEEIVILIAANEGYLDKVEIKDVARSIGELLVEVETASKALTERIEMEKEYNADIQKGLKEAIEKFYKKA